MNNRSGPRSFYTVKRSNREERLRRRMQGRLTLLAICAVLILLAVSGLVLFIANLANAKPRDPSSDPTAEITFQTVTLTVADMRKGDLIVVNSAHIYTFPSPRLEDLSASAKTAYLLASYRQQLGGSNPYSLDLSKEHLMMPNAAQALNDMLEQNCLATGESAINVHTTYRTEADQASGQFAPGYSEHHTGLLVRLQVWNAGGTYSDLKEADRPWIFRNCHSYGFIQRYPAAKAGITGVSNYEECFRYVGVPHATYIKQNGLCLEDYVTLLKNNHSTTNGSNLKMLSVDTNGDGISDYGVYYVPVNAAGDLTAVPVPNGLTYTVSGDNIGGFIITVTLQ